MAEAIAVAPVATRRDLQDFIELPYRLYAGDPHFVPPLRLERREMLSPAKNPFFEHAEVALFLARCQGRVVGRISAQMDREHEKRQRDGAGFFGFFESEPDPEVAGALLDAAEGWLRARGARLSRGPYCFNINGESGLLVEGFDSPPYLMMGHNPSWYPALLEAHGYAKAKDLYAWIYRVGEIPSEIVDIAEKVRAHPGLTIRSADRRALLRDVHIFMEVFNSAWSENWGFVPLTEREIEKMAKDLSLILEPDMALIAELDGRPAAIVLALPNVHEAMRDLGGRLFPFGLFKLYWRMKRRKVRSARLVLLGIRREFRGSAFGGLSILLYVESHRRAKALGMTEGELSWTLEDNDRINRGIELMGGRRYKTYRIYERLLGA
jgi:hypothetical protein